MSALLEILSFYRFFPLAPDEIALRRLSLETSAARLELTGLIILAPEGCNGTVAGTWEAVSIFRRSLNRVFGLTDGVSEGDDDSAPVTSWSWKESVARHRAFPRFRVKIRDQIVTSGSGVSLGRTDHETHLSPAEWQRHIESDEPYVLLDVRNSYEIGLGTFRGSVDPGLATFQDFPRWIRSSDLPRKRKVLMYCTGGIRCEKAIHEMLSAGFREVYQLSGGILKYLEELPDRDFVGECFVFDGRVALDQSLAPTRQWALCRRCGQPARRRAAGDDETASFCECCTDSSGEQYPTSAEEGGDRCGAERAGRSIAIGALDNGRNGV